jgi:hypothetical protein
MTPELDQPFGRHRWDPPAGTEASMTNDATPATGSEDNPVAAQPTSPDASG